MHLKNEFRTETNKGWSMKKLKERSTNYTRSDEEFKRMKNKRIIGKTSITTRREKKLSLGLNGVMWCSKLLLNEVIEKLNEKKANGEREVIIK